MTALSLVMLAIAVLPSDRLAMADRLFNRGRAAEARKEYAALALEGKIAADEIVFRLAECDRTTGNNDAARQRYLEIIEKYPDSKHVTRSRFLYAIGAKGDERRRLLRELDTDRIDTETRAAALYHLGTETSDLETLEKCKKIDPNGKYAVYADLRRGTLLTASPDDAKRRKGVEILLGIAFGKSDLAEEALYLSGIQSYRDKRYGEAGSLFRRYRKMFAKGAHFDECRSMSVWCDFMEGRYADAAAACGEAETDDLAYIKAACAYSLGDNEKALALFKKYLAEFPNGHYRADAELPVARIEFDTAQKAGNVDGTIESARRGFAMSKLAADELRLAWAYEKANKPDLASSEYSRLAKSFPDSEEAAEAMYRKAMIEARDNNWSGAEMALTEALANGKIGKRRGLALYWRGVSAMKLGHETEGAESLREALKEGGLSLDEAREARLMTADVDYKNGRMDAAREAYAKLVDEGACERMSAARILAVGKLLGGERAIACAKALVASDTPEWRQAGWTLLGTSEEKRDSFVAAMDAYRKALDEKATTEDAAQAAFRLGVLEFRQGQHDQAEKTLKTAVSMNSSNAKIRAEAYVTLAKNSEAKGDFRTACAYATVVTSLFEDDESCVEAKKILAAHPEVDE